jgi:uncharacterized membrane protein
MRGAIAEKRPAGHLGRLLAPFLVAALTLLSSGQAWAAQEGAGGSGGAWKVIVVIACFWLVILAAVLLNVYRIRRKERKEEEAGVEFKGKEL